MLRFWEGKKYFVVLGYSNKIRAEVAITSCKALGVPILRRSSGGGTVLQGPGCLNFSLILNTQNGRPLKNLVETNCYVMAHHQKALQPLINSPISVEGFTDLTLNRLKFSGNAQRRKKRFLLFHGSFLLKFDLEKIEQYLPIPKKQPNYRKNRTHKDFLTNLNLPAEKIKRALKKIWSAEERTRVMLKDHIDKLVKKRYDKQEWNFKF